jgi:hypothetical protein
MPAASIPTTMPVGIPTLSTPFAITAAMMAKSVTHKIDLSNYLTGTTISAIVQLLLNGAWKQIAAFTCNDRGFELDGKTPAAFTGVTIFFDQPLPDTQTRLIVTVAGNPLLTSINSSAV